jgi:hypothetical protein
MVSSLPKLMLFIKHGIRQFLGHIKNMKMQFKVRLEALEQMNIGKDLVKTE